MTGAATPAPAAVPPSIPPAAPARAAASTPAPAAFLAVVAVAVVAGRLGAGDGAETVAAVAVLAYVATQAPRLATPGRMMLGLVAVLTVAALAVAEAPGALIRHGAAQGAGFAALVATLTLLREAASTSRLLHACGEHLIHQPPGRRYAMLTLGCHLIGLVLNFGALTLLATMVERTNTVALASGDPRLRDIRRRRMHLALLRGFAALQMWSPLSVALAATLAAVHGVAWSQVLAPALATATMAMVLGWSLDRRGPRAVERKLALARAGGRPNPRGGEPPTRPWSYKFRGGRGPDSEKFTGSKGRGPLAVQGNARRLPARIPPAPRPRHGRSTPATASLLRLAALAAAMMAAAGVCSLLPGFRLLDGVTVAAALSALVWLTVQHADAGAATALRRAGGRLRGGAVALFPECRAEVTMLCGAAFSGVVIAGLLPPGVVGHLLSTLHLPPQVVLVALPWLVVAAGQLGLTPILSITVLGAAVPDPAAVGIKPVVLVVGFLAAWGLTAGSAPVAAATLMIGRLAHVAPAQIARWNRRYTLVAVAALGAWLVALDRLL